MQVPDNFLGLPEPVSLYDHAKVIILPLPYEETVSYGSGTALAPQAIISASQQVELYDREFDAEPALDYGIHTLAAAAFDGKTPAQVMDTITGIVSAHARAGKFVVGLGGEHSLSLGVGRGLLQATQAPITIVQIDAHCDLRNEYDDSPYSHAAVMRRLLEEPQVEQVLQLGIRSLCPEEIAFVRANPEKVRLWFAEDVHAGNWQAELIERIGGKPVFLTIDVDGLDPSIVPATGTPEPDGLSWQQTLSILRTVSASSAVIGMDCVELAPNPHLHMADFAVAKLVYKAITYALRFQKKE